MQHLHIFVPCRGGNATRYACFVIEKRKKDVGATGLEVRIDLYACKAQHNYLNESNLKELRNYFSYLYKI